MYTLPPIKTVNQLIHILHTGPGYDGYATLLQSIDFGTDALEKYCTWDKQIYTKNSIEKIPSFELSVICWEKGQATPVHDHSNQESWFTIIEGELTKTVYSKPDTDMKPLNKTSSNVYKKSEVGYMTDSYGLHKLQNSFEGRTISIHLYSESYDSENQFDEQTSKLL